MLVEKSIYITIGGHGTKQEHHLVSLFRLLQLYQKFKIWFGFHLMCTVLLPKSHLAQLPAFTKYFWAAANSKAQLPFSHRRCCPPKKLRHFWLSKLGWSFLFPTFVILVWKVNLAIIWGYPLLCNFHIFSLLVFHNYVMYSIPIQR